SGSRVTDEKRPPYVRNAETPEPTRLATIKNFESGVSFSMCERTGVEPFAFSALDYRIPS
ncbi:MAG TPA: hypothetical protein VF103_11115, partial [Polyangiaceae bacterium]